jgi:hypothetical protein
MAIYEEGEERHPSYARCSAIENLAEEVVAVPLTELSAD